MTLLVANKPLDAETTNLTANILDLNAGPHTFTFKNFKQILNIENNEAVPLTINLLGQGVTSFECPGVGTIDVSTGKDIVVAAGDIITINIPELNGYMGAPDNTVDLAITGSTAPSLAFCWLNEYS